ncbi:MAG: hypothetical protein Q4C56_09140 [Peptococcaceae bacterium]|nr:hypothetical protein [Peptococcaceae bacterium]
MRQKNFEEALQAALAEPQEAAVPEALRRVARLQARARARQKRIGFAALLGRQVRFLGWRVWLGQLALLVCSQRAMALFYGQTLLVEPLYGMRLLALLTLLVTASAWPMLVMADHYRMQEVEAATFFSTQRLLAAKLIIIGVGDAALLAALFALSFCYTQLEAASIVLCLLLPFLLATSSSLTILERFSRAHFLPAGGSALLALYMMLHVAAPWLVRYSGWSAALCVILAGYLAWTLRRLLHSPALAERLLSH